MDLRRFGELVNEARQRAGLTQQGLADEMSDMLSLLVSQQSVANWCRGRNLPGDRTTLLTLCQALYEAGGLTSLGEINEVLFTAEAGALHQSELEERFPALLQHEQANPPNASPHIPPSPTTSQTGHFVGTFQLFGGSPPPSSTNPAPPNPRQNDPVQSVMGQFRGFWSPYYWLGASVGLVVVLLIAMIVIIARLAPQQYEALLTARRPESGNSGAISYKTSPSLIPSNISERLPTNEARSTSPSSQLPVPTVPTETITSISTETSPSTPLPTAPSTPLSTATQTPLPPPATKTPTNTPIPPPNTPTYTPIPPPNTPTYTPIPPTNIPPTNIPTNIPIPPPKTPTYTPIPPTKTPTYTPIPPTNISIPLTNTPTFTPIPPTNTPTFPPIPPTFTPIPPTNTPTFTPIPPTNTPTFTPIPPTNTPTFTPIPLTSTPSPTIPSLTSTPVPTDTPLTTCETQNFPAPELTRQDAGTRWLVSLSEVHLALAHQE